MVRGNMPQGRRFIVDYCGFVPGSELNYEVLDLEEDKIFDWPMIYILNNNKEAYVGQTTSVKRRMRQHGENREKKAFRQVNVIFNEEFNLSVVTDYESKLIQLMHADGKYVITNKNGGISNANYFSKPTYDSLFSELWQELASIKLVEHSLVELEDSEIFKYSPFKELTVDQHIAMQKIVEAINDSHDKPIIIEGMPGSGKTILAVFLFKLLRDSPQYKDKNIKLVIPPTSIRKSIKNVFKHTMNLDPKDVIGPSELVKPEKGFSGMGQNYDILLVDEAHRLHQRKNVMNHNTFIKTNRKLGLDESAGELDWIFDQCRLPVLFYDNLQVVGPSGTSQKLLSRRIEKEFQTPPTVIPLTSQMRVKGGSLYIDYIQALLNNRHPAEVVEWDDYEFCLVDSPTKFEELFNEKLFEHSLTRMVAGYAWPWATKGGKPGLDIDLGCGVELRWNCGTENWVAKGFDDAKIAKEVGCIHSIQGFDLSYAFVILGRDIRFNNETQCIEIVRDNYFDRYGKNGTNDSELLEYIRNIYYVLLTRGIYGTYMYVCDEVLREHLAKYARIIEG